MVITIHIVLAVQMMYCIGKIFWNEMKKKDHQRKKQTDNTFYLLLMSLPYRYCKLRLAETKICFGRFRNVSLYLSYFIFCLMKLKLQGRLSLVIFYESVLDLSA